MHDRPKYEEKLILFLKSHFYFFFIHYMMLKNVNFCH